MKVLLINPPVKFEELFGGGGKEMGTKLPPLGLAYLASYLEKNDIKVKIIDGMAEETDIYDLAKRAKDYDIVGSTSNTFFALRVHEQMREIKKLYPDKITVVGGCHASVIPLEILEDKNIDIVVIGEAEITLYELVRHIDKYGMKNLEAVDGIAYRDGGKAKITKPRKLIFNLDALPFPARHLLPMDAYFASDIRCKNHPALSLVSSRGCNNHCTFCGNDLVFRKVWRAFSAEYVVNEIEELIDKYKAKEINFWDDNFALNNKRVFDICRLLKERGVDIPIEASGRVDCINPPLLKAMRRAGFYFLGFGVESGSNRILKDVGKNINTDMIMNAFKMCRDEGFITRAYVMLGLIGETRQEMHGTINFVKKLNPDYASFTLLVPLPGTKDYYRAQKEGTFDKDYYKKQICAEINFPKNPIYIPNGIAKEELIRIHKGAYSSFYFRKEYIWKQLKQSDFKEFLNMAKGALTLIKYKIRRQE